jgi:hypothetical protein
LPAGAGESHVKYIVRLVGDPAKIRNAHPPPPPRIQH